MRISHTFDPKLAKIGDKIFRGPIFFHLYLKIFMSMHPIIWPKTDSPGEIGQNWFKSTFSDGVFTPLY